MVPSGGLNWLALTLLCFHIPFLLVQARLHPPHARHAGVGKRDALSDSGLSSASWIWASGATTGNAAFMKTFTSATGKTAVAATVSLTAVNDCTLWVNGEPIGKSGDWTKAQVLSAALNASSNTFSVLAVNSGASGAPPPGLVAAVKVQYSDNSADSFVSDASWQATANIPADFPTPADTSHFAAATVAANFGAGAWGNSVSVAAPDPNALSLSSFSSSTWIWSTSDAEYAAAAGTVGFRKTVATPSGKSAVSAKILLTGDNYFALYIGNKYIGAPPWQADPNDEDYAWRRAQQVSVPLSAAANTFTVIVQNFNFPSGQTSPGGLLVVIRILYTDGSSDLVYTDPTWLNGPVANIASAAAFLAAPDSTLAGSFTVAAVGVWPWGALTGVYDLLAAADVPSSPFSSSSAAVPPVAPNGDAKPGASAGSGTTTPGTTTPGTTTAGAGAQSAGLAYTTIITGSGGSVSTVVSTLRVGDSSSATGTALNAGSASGSGPLPSPTGGPAIDASAHTHTVLIAAVVGAVASALTLFVVGVVAFRWRRRRQSTPHRSRGSSITPFAAEAPESPLGASSVVSASRASLVSARRVEMAEVAPIALGSADRANSQSPGVANDSDATPRPPSLRSPAAIPPTKLEREIMMRGGVSGTPNSDLTPPGRENSMNAYAEGVLSRAPSDGRQESVYGHADPEADTLPPPSYYAE